MVTLKSYLSGSWQVGTGTDTILFNPSTEEPVAKSNTNGLDFAAALQYARTKGGPVLRSMTFAERSELLKEMSRVLHEQRERLLDISCDCNGATRGDSKFDVDGATATLSSYARLGSKLGEHGFRIDGSASNLAANARYVGQHVLLPRPGVAVHINAFNFPAWGTFEKIATAILAGMPVISKPATSTAWLAYEMIKVVIDSGVVPDGVLSFVAGSSGDMLNHLGPQDVVAFTGAASTAAQLRSGMPFLHKSTRFNAEADSLNAAIIGPDVEPGDDLWALVVRNIVTDMTQKAGQKCTAIRRVFVPQEHVDALEESIKDGLHELKIGYPSDSAVRMGPVASAAQLRDVRAGISSLAEYADIVVGGPDAISGINAPEGKGYFVAPTLLRARDAHNPIFHEIEVFGPCATILPYSGEAKEGAELIAKGEGCLVSSAYSNDRNWLREICFEAAPWNGRLQLCSKKVSDSALPPGMVLPNQLHGGPGRAGGGEELGGERGMALYCNRVAIQGDRLMLSQLLGSDI